MRGVSFTTNNPKPTTCHASRRKKKSKQDFDRILLASLTSTKLAMPFCLLYFVDSLI